MSTVNFNSLVAEFCKSVGLEGVCVNDDGYYSFSLDENLAVELQYETDSGMIGFFLQLGQVSSANRAGIMADMLDANVLWRGTGGGTLGLDSSSGIATLAYQETVEHMSYSRFEAILGLLISNAEIWAKRISADSAAPGNPGERIPPADFVRA